MKFLVATTNPGKVAELSAIIGNDFELVSLAEVKNITEVNEDGNTFAENARKKALGYSRQTGLPTLADDSGLVVDALNGAPGVNSARFSGKKAKTDDRGLLDHCNMTKVLELMAGVPNEKRTARFVCNLCFAAEGKAIFETQGRLEGIITTEEKGCNGFGYDPIFFVPEFGGTVAEMAADEKNKISHRAKAVENFVKFILNANF